MNFIKQKKYSFLGLLLLLAILPALLFATQSQKYDIRKKAAETLINCGTLAPNVCSESPQFADILQNPVSLPEIEKIITSDFFTLNFEQKARISAAYILKRFINTNSIFARNENTKRMVTNIVTAYKNINRDLVDKYQQSLLQEHLYNRLWGVLFYEIIKDNMDKDDETFFQILTDNKTLDEYTSSIAKIFDNNFVVSEQNHQAKISSLKNLPTEIPQRLRDQISLLAEIFPYDRNDIAETNKMKYILLDLLEKRVRSENYQQLADCSFFEPFINENYAFFYWYHSDINPDYAQKVSIKLNELNLSCFNRLKDIFITISEVWREYREFVQRNWDVFGGQPNEAAVLARFNIAKSKIDNYQIFGSKDSPLNTIEQFMAIEALEIKKLTGSYFFTPSKGLAVYNNIKETQNKISWDYTAYVYPPAPGEDWFPNMVDYGREQPGKNTYIHYLIAHKKVMDALLYTSNYNLPSTHFDYRNFFITTMSFLNERKSLLRDKITGFETYPLPDISHMDIHPYKVQTVGPVIPGVEAKLSAEDTWRKVCSTNDDAGGFAYTAPDGVTYCLDAGGVHERGHLSMKMVDFYHFNSNDFFWNSDQNRCLLFANFRSKSPYFLANHIADKTLSISSSISKFTAADWENINHFTYGTNLTDPRFNNIYNTFSINLILDNPNLEISNIDWLYIDDQQKILPLTTELIKNPQGQVTGVKVEIYDLYQKMKGGFHYLFLSYSDGKTDGFVIPIYIIDHVFLQLKRAKILTADPSITINLLTSHRKEEIAKLPQVKCDTPENVRAAADIFHKNPFQISSGIRSDISSLVSDPQAYMVISLPLNIRYVYRFTDSQPYEFPTDWSGPMPNLPQPLSPTPSSIPTQTLGPICQKLLETIAASLPSVCGDKNYDKIADLNKDRRVNILDFSLLQANSQNEQWCTERRNDLRDPCLSASVTPMPTPVLTPVTARNAITWQTSYVSLQADDFYIMTAGKRYLDNTADLELHSSPPYRPNPNYTSTTLEATWHENGVEMRLYFYFYKDNNKWWVPEIRTYNGQTQGDWIYYTGRFFESPLGTPFVGSVDLPSDPSNQISGSIHFQNLRLQPFLNTSTPTPTSTPIPQTIRRKISSPSDDHYQINGTGNQFTDVIYFGKYSATTNYQAAFRFTNLPIPVGTRIKSAKLRLAAKSYMDDVTNKKAGTIKIYGEKTGNSTASNQGAIAGRIPTGNVITWQVIGTGGVWNSKQYKESSDISSIINEIVSLSTWKSGNAITLILKDSSSPFWYVYPYEVDPNLSAELVVEY